MKIGLYFGSFNPIHIGHLIIARHLLDNSTLEQIWFVVSPQNPFKSKTGLLNEYQRLHLVNLSIEGENRLKASNIEFNLPRPSFTIDTLTYLSEKYPDQTYSIIMGSDSYVNLDRWKSSQLIKERYELYVYERNGFPVNRTTHLEKVHFIEAPLLDISASYIRKQIKMGKSIRYLVTDAVHDEIMKAGYYH
jgi:nicotinate-nucleotide adenylyltransferase